jgi:hypothetical protein
MCVRVRLMELNDALGSGMTQARVNGLVFISGDGKRTASRESVYKSLISPV